MTRKSLLHKAGLSAMLSLLIASCAKDEMLNGRQIGEGIIGFDITALDAAGNASQTRTATDDDTPVMLLAKNGADTLYLHPSVEQNLHAPAGKRATTKGTPVTTDNFSEQCKDFGVTAYTQNDHKLYIADEKIDRNTNNIWTSSGDTRYWPSEETVLDFYAYAPYTYKGEPVFTHKSAIRCEGNTIRFSYTVPTGKDENDQPADAMMQPDIMFSYTACSQATTEPEGTVSLTFSHALAGVKFVANDISGGTIHTITLKNLYGQGACVYTASTSAGGNEGTEKPKGTFKWTPEGTQKNFTQTFNVFVNEGTADDQQPITEKNPETTFMMIPQSLQNAEVEINITTTAGETHTLVGSLAQTNGGQWEAGKIYTYSISTESINWEYTIEVTPSIELPLGTITGNYTVESYRIRKGDSSIKEAVEWSAVPISATETDSYTGTTTDYLSNISQLVTEFTVNGGTNHANYEESYPIVLTNTPMQTSYKCDETLKKAPAKGSPESPYDLSTEGGSISMTTANCYIVNAPGTYQLPLVYGNAIKDGGTNEEAYNNDAFVNHLGQRITSPYIKENSGCTPHDCALVWSDGFYMFKDVHLSEDEDYLVFTLDCQFMQQANAIVAVRDDDGNIMWSWHIWVTEHEDIYGTYEIDDWDNASTKYHLMKYNLGWVDGKQVYYNERNVTYLFTQKGSGKTAEMKVIQKGATFNYKDAGSTYYQWGRKDPIVALRNRDQIGGADYRLHETSEEKYQYKYEIEQVPISESIKNPNILYTRKNDWPTTWMSSGYSEQLWDNTADNNINVNGTENATTETETVKTIYDPSPRGFKVPFAKVFAVFVNGEKRSPSLGPLGTLNGYQKEAPDDYIYIVYPSKDKGGTPIELISTGQRLERDNPALGEMGGLWAMYGVYFWASNTLNKTIGYSLVIRNDPPGKGTDKVYTYGFQGSIPMARPVRSMKEE